MNFKLDAQGTSNEILNQLIQINAHSRLILDKVIDIQEMMAQGKDTSDETVSSELNEKLNQVLEEVYIRSGKLEM